MPCGPTTTLGGLAQLLKETHKLVLLELHLPRADKAITVYAKGRAPGDTNLNEPMRALIEKATEKPLGGATLYPLGGILFQTTDGDDVTCAKVVLQLS